MYNISKIALLLSFANVVNANAADQFVEKLQCSGNVFYGTNVQTSREQGVLATYTPIEVNGSYCRIYPRNKLPVTASTCMSFQHQPTNLKVSDCVIAREASDATDGYEYYLF